MDALLTQRDIAALIVDAEGDYVMPVKENHEAVHKELHSLFRHPELLDVSLSTAETLPIRSRFSLDTKRGRLETRRMTVMGATETWGTLSFADYFDWPGLQQVYHLEREVKVLRTGEVSREVEVGLTSLPRKRADAKTLLKLRRGIGILKTVSIMFGM